VRSKDLGRILGDFFKRMECALNVTARREELQVSSRSRPYVKRNWSWRDIGICLPHEKRPGAKLPAKVEQGLGGLEAEPQTKLDLPRAVTVKLPVQ